MSSVEAHPELSAEARAAMSDRAKVKWREATLERRKSILAALQRGMAKMLSHRKTKPESFVESILVEIKTEFLF